VRHLPTGHQLLIIAAVHRGSPSPLSGTGSETIREIAGVFTRLAPGEGPAQYGRDRRQLREKYFRNLQTETSVN
jgi:hypothetical protein